MPNEKPEASEHEPTEPENQPTEPATGTRLIPDVNKMTMDELNMLLQIDELNPEGSCSFDLDENEEPAPGFRFTLQ